MAFFSGQDTLTLQDQGNDKNCFVSLVVDTRGTYVACITRKITTAKEIKTTEKSKSYPFFGEGEVQLPHNTTPTVKNTKETVIEYYNLAVERHTVEEPFAYLDERFEEIDAKNKKALNDKWLNYQSHTPISTFPSTATRGVQSPKTQGFNANVRGNDNIVSQSEIDWNEFGGDYHTPTKPITTDASGNEQLLPMEEADYDALIATVEVDEKEIHKAVARILCCSLLVNPDKINFKQWVTCNMEKTYDRLFKVPKGMPQMSSMEEFMEGFIQWIVSNFTGATVDYSKLMKYDIDENMLADAVVAMRIQDEILSYGENKYTEVISKLLDEEYINILFS